MAHKDDIRAGMQVLGSDGGMVGRVTGLHGDHIHIQPDAPEPAGDRLIPNKWIARVDDHVHLDRTAALARDSWGTQEADGTPAGAAAPFRHEAAHSGVGRSWIVWAIGAILLLVVIVIGIRACAYGVTDTDYGDSPRTGLSDADRAASGAAAADRVGAVPVGIDSEMGRFLASEQAPPRAFPLANLRFNDGNAELPSASRQELAMVGRMLTAYPDARLRVTSSAEGEIAEELAERRAEAIAAALIANGVPPANIETAIGEAGSELVVLSR